MDHEMDVASLTYELFSSLRKSKTFQDSLSHQILEYMHEALDIYENKKLIAQFVYKSRDESFELS